MKKQILMMSAIMIATFSAYAQEKHEHNDKKGTTAVTTNAASAQTSTVVNANVTASMKEIVTRYLALKNALVGDNTKQAATAGTALETAFKNYDKKDLTPKQKKVYEDVEDDAREHAEHIGANGGNIEHQREHFLMLSKDMYDLVKTFAAGQLLYKDFCPMANDGKGALWISEYKEVKNPYFGKKMMTCGSMKEEIK